MKDGEVFHQLTSYCISNIICTHVYQNGHFNQRMPTLTLFHYFMNNVSGGLKIKMKKINEKNPFFKDKAADLRLTKNRRFLRHSSNTSHDCNKERHSNRINITRWCACVTGYKKVVLLISADEIKNYGKRTKAPGDENMSV